MDPLTPKLTHPRPIRPPSQDDVDPSSPPTRLGHEEDVYEERRPTRNLGQPRSIESITTAAAYREWLSGKAARLKAMAGEERISVERRRQFFDHARQSIANSAMNPRERALAIGALKEAELIFDRG